MTAPAPPLALLAELTHRCPLRCPYCSNPLELERASQEMATAEWRRVLEEAAALGVLQVHFSGGEPTVRRDLEALVRHAAELRLYTNLITAGVLLDRSRIDRLAKAGLDHVQLSLQDSAEADADRVAGRSHSHAKKLAVAGWVRSADLALTINAVVHRQNLDRLEEIIDLAASLGAERLEIAHAQYHGWALRNRSALMPTRAQVDRAVEVVERARSRLRGALVIDCVAPDHHAQRPKACMGGWGQRFLNVTPAGRVLPCHAAESLPGFRFDRVQDRPLAAIWERSEAFERFRGVAWMPEPCRSCARRVIDWGGCRCQAFALTGDATNPDPVCALSPHHPTVADLANAAVRSERPDFAYRQFPNGGPARDRATPLNEQHVRPERAP